MMYEINLSALIVTYNPDLDVLHNLVNKLKYQVSTIFIIDNNSTNVDKLPRDGVSLVPLEENVGIAEALNVGISHARNNGADSVIFFDQDSDPSLNLVSSLLKTREKAYQDGIKVSAIGPFYKDIRTGTFSFYVFTCQNKMNKVYYEQLMDNNVSYGRCDFIISSGTLVNINVLDDVGMMNADLFIDAVDIEWCYRAKSYGYDCIVDVGSVMEHCIGNDVKVFCGKELYIHSPLRDYYFFRNFLYLLFSRHVSFPWKKNIMYKIFILSIFSIFIYPEKIKRFKYISLSIWDFFVKRFGKCKYDL